MAAAGFGIEKSQGKTFPNSFVNDALLFFHGDTERIQIGAREDEATTSLITIRGINERKTHFHSLVEVDSNITVYGDAVFKKGTRIEGDLEVNGVMTTLNTEVRTTDQFSICNDGTGPALVVDQFGEQPIAQFKDDGEIMVTIADGGLVGIGTETPAEKLHVVGNILGYENLKIMGDAEFGSNVTVSGTLTTSNLEIARDLTVNGVTTLNDVTTMESRLDLNDHLTLSNTTTNVALTVDQRGNEAIAQFHDVGSLVMTIVKGGSVGIGTESPQAKLHVEGAIRGSSNLNIMEDTQLGGDLTVDGLSTLRGHAQLDSNLTVDGTSTLVGDAQLDGTLTVDGLSTLRGDAQLDSTLTVDGISTLNSNLDLNGHFALSNNSSNVALTVHQEGNEAVAEFHDDGVMVMTITKGGLVGIGTDAPKEKLHVEGSILSTSEFTTESDERVKENIHLIENGLKKVMELNGYTFTLKKDNVGDDDGSESEGSKNINTKAKAKKKMGVLAQEVLKIIPEVVNYDEDSDSYSVAYGNIVGVLIEGIKDLAHEVTDLTGEMTRLSAENKQMAIDIRDIRDLLESCQKK